MNAQDLTLEEKIGQMLIIRIEEEKITQKTIEMIVKYKIGGIILYRKNYKTYNELLNLVNKIKEINQQNKIPIFITIDQEGGRVNRLPPEIHVLKNANAIASTNNIDIIKKSGEIIGKILKNTGINLNYAPVLDIQRFENKHAIGNRCYGNNKEDVTKYGIEVMKSLQKENVISAIKHFPGHGATTKDSHFFIPIIKEKIKALEENDLYPFKKAIENEADAVMIGHLLVKDIDKRYPASLSEKIIKLLREKYNFNGLIITDDLKMLAIKLHYNMNLAIRKAITSGNDLILLGLPYKNVQKLLKKLYKKFTHTDIAKIDESVNRILKIKEKYNITDDIALGIDTEKINKDIDEINNYVINNIKNSNS